MPFKIVYGDITTMQVDAIVNAANSRLLQGGGVCGAIFRKAGPARLQEACDQAAPVATGHAAITPGFDLPAKYVIHAVGPIYRADQAELCRRQLASAYTESLKLADEHHCADIAFPLISSGIYGYPKAEAQAVAEDAIRTYLKQSDLMVYLVLYGGGR
ncbi:macro domain-containing protein [Catenisphaera adipataccumulans]|jgi:O-acetyl-ADP-ribose deacetylase (regulator of RNase III)|uniref:O-acetyl-ADP-ribose deacetylase (Regulator of RNase III) n=1 Tax=Catenisphaera adipataccumulans TaxID=700500 RepID=A0A7W8CX05_9FIRM|nr:macro domain-containing protein [Catenisphaera adipataccumulans]MBB5183156.1 O-acetyl-ADP-ribose deacetylase (regulator of RNase III) [Catenisphaera adipataccumulans]